jgi:hypothetical protein
LCKPTRIANQALTEERETLVDKPHRRTSASVAALRTRLLRRTSVPSAEAYFADTGNYTAMTALGLKGAYDSGLKIAAAGNHGVTLTTTAATYCFEQRVGMRPTRSTSVVPAARLSRATLRKPPEPLIASTEGRGQPRPFFFP